MKKILIVDDEVQILKSLSRVFFDTDYEIFTAGNGEEALNFLEDNEVNLVISDMRMPLMDGYELLSRIKSRYPKIIRIILSGYSEESAIFKAILHNIAKFYILKPWDNNKLLEYINQIFETEDIINSKHLLQLINNLEKLPTIEESYQKILDMIENNTDISYIASEIEKDFAISTKLLQIANSAYFGVKTGSVKHAAVYLGLHNLKSLIYSTSIITSGQTSYEGKKYASMLWEHAMQTNKIVHYIYEVFLNTKIPEPAFSAGLLHNIGTLVLIQNHVANYSDCIKKAKTESLNLLQLETKIFGVTHQEVGGYLVSWWELPFPIVESALFHHRPLDPNIINKSVVAAVHIAQQYAWVLMKEPPVTEFFPEAFEILGISMEDFENAIKQSIFV